MTFQDRRDAGQVLAKAVAELPDLKDAVVIGLPRGGVPVAYEVARGCGLELDILVVRKLGVPGQEELAMGAIASGGTVVLNSNIVEATHVSKEELGAEVERAMREIERQEHAFREGREPLKIEGRIVILVDDGLATGATMRAAVGAVKELARRVVVAVPVGARSTCAELSNEVERVICPVMPKSFGAVGRFYRDFEPTTDEEVKALLRQGAGTDQDRESQNRV